MNSSVTTTNATNGAIITITTIHHPAFSSLLYISLAALAVVLIAAGLYLLFRKEKSGK
jgi:hypothetical protein